MLFDLNNTPPQAAFPDPELAEREPDGLLAVGGDLHPERLLRAYRSGLFPWYSVGQPILWWSPDPRMVLYPGEAHLSRSLRKHLRRAGLVVRFNTAFEAVIRACATAPRDHEGTWLLPEMIRAYRRLHALQMAHSIEIWHDRSLVGGLYGVAMHGMFFGESMFSREDNASKTALVALSRLAVRDGIELIDCQVYTPHLASLGAVEIPRSEFLGRLATAQAAHPLYAWQPPRAEMACAELLDSL